MKNGTPDNVNDAQCTPVETILIKSEPLHLDKAMEETIKVELIAPDDDPGIIDVKTDVA